MFDIEIGRRLPRSRRTFVAAIAVAAATLCTGALPAQAGFLDIIFGGPQPQPSRAVPLEMTVRSEQSLPSL